MQDNKRYMYYLSIYSEEYNADHDNRFWPLLLYYKPEHINAEQTISASQELQIKVLHLKENNLVLFKQAKIPRLCGVPFPYSTTKE